MTKNNEQEITIESKKYKHLKFREHVMLRTDTYLGPMKLTKYDMWYARMLGKDHDNIMKLEFVYSSVEIVYALLHMMVEALANALDNAHNTAKAGRKPGIIRINVDKEFVSIYNEGDHIPVERNDDDTMWRPQELFARKFTSSNYDDNKRRTTVGRNGYGVKVALIMCDMATLDITDPVAHKRYQQTFKHNMDPKYIETHPPKISDWTQHKSYTHLTYWPDFVRLGIDNNTDDMIGLYFRLAVDAAASSGIPIYFNDENVTLACSNIEKYFSMFNTDIVPFNSLTFSSENEDIRFYLADTPDNGFMTSIVNNQMTPGGGVHMDYILKPFVERIVSAVKSKKDHANARIERKTVYPHLSLIAICILPNPDYGGGATKERLISPEPEFDIPDHIVERVVKWEVVKRMMSELKARNYSKLSGTKAAFVNNPYLDDAELAGTKHSSETVLIIPEGKSAAKLSAKAFSDRARYGILPIRGKIINTENATTERYDKNAEIIAITKALGLKPDVAYDNDHDISRLRYGKLYIMTDADYDGSHCKALLLLIFGVNYANLLRNRYVLVVNTPIMRVYKTPKTRAAKQRRNVALTGVEFFYTETEYILWRDTKSDTEIKDWEIEYLKGLGSIPNDSISIIFADPRIVEIVYDKNAHESLMLAFEEERSDDRKIWMQNFSEDDYNKVRQRRYDLSVTRFINHEFKAFCIYNMERQVPNIYDGLKPVQRKILYTILTQPVKRRTVPELQGLVSNLTQYHHGPESMNNAIIRMMQFHVGTNNVPLLYSNDVGTGDRRNPRDETSAPRYLHCELADITPHIFMAIDAPLLTYLNVDGSVVEPSFYVPIIAYILLSNVLGMGSGWSSNIPMYALSDIINETELWIRLYDEDKSYIEYCEEHKRFNHMEPHYNGYKGKIEWDRKLHKFYSYGDFEYTDEGIHITELPVGVDIETYLKSFVPKKKRGTKELVAPIKCKKYQNLSNYDDKTFELDISIKIDGVYDTTLKDMKLRKSIPITNMCALDESKVPSKYETPEHIINKHAHKRIHCYKLRRKLQIRELKKNLAREKLRLQFLIDVYIDKTLDLRGRTKSNLHADMEARSYPLDFLRMAIASFTDSKLDKIHKHIETIQAQLQYYVDSTPSTLWKADLAVLRDKVK